MNEPDLENSIFCAHSCGVKLDEMVEEMANKSDEEKIVFWSMFLGYAASIAVKQVSPMSTLTILQSLVTAVTKDELNTNLH